MDEQSTAAPATPAVKFSTPPAPVVRVPDYHLVVRHPFDDYGKGAWITDADEIDAILAGSNANSVHKIAAQ